MEYRAVQDDELQEQLAIIWHDSEIRRLDGILMDHGIEDPQKRREIVEAFFFSQAVQFDGCVVGGVVEHESVPYHPRLAFMAEAGSPPALVMPTDKYDLHDYTYSSTTELYEAGGQ